jgi:predicted PurR-regulated permease PerM
VLIPIVLALLTSYALEPIVARFEHWHVPRALGVPFVMVSLVTVLGGTIYLLRGEAATFIGRLPAAAHRVSTAVQGASTGRSGPMGQMQAAARELERAAASARQHASADGVTSVRVEEPTFRWSEWLWSGSRNVGAFIAQLFVVLCLTYYLLAAGDLYKRKLIHIVPTLADKKITLHILEEIDRQIERFLLARVAISVVVSVAIWIGFRVSGVENAGVWAVLAAVLFAIPIAGPALFIVAAAAAAFVQFGSLSMVLTLTGLCVTIAAIEGNVLTPWLMSFAGEMSAVAVFVSLLFWGWIWGLWGVLLAVPITAAIQGGLRAYTGTPTHDRVPEEVGSRESPIVRRVVRPCPWMRQRRLQNIAGPS